MKENARFELQKKLDSLKSQTERNKLGQFSTPFDLAYSIAEYVISSNRLKSDIAFLEPAIGSGVFYSALSRQLPISSAVGYEIDKHYFSPFNDFWEDSNLKLIHADFLKEVPNNNFDLIISNPPYSRHHHIEAGEKRRLQQLVKDNFGISISGLAGLYCYFLMLSTLWLKEGGISCWLIPSEFMEVNYGTAVRKFLLECVDLISIHKYASEDLQFSDALVSSSVVVFKNSKPSHQAVTFSSGEDILSPDQSKLISVDQIDYRTKWSMYFDDQKKEFGDVPLGRYFDISRGIATGNNSFFILSKDEVERRKLPYAFLTPILPSPRYLDIDEVNGHGKTIELDKKQYILSCSLPIDTIKTEYPSLYEYIFEAENNGENQRYNCLKRHPWYKCESRSTAPFFMTYMGRGTNFDRMFRFILNNSSAVVSNSYLMLYPKEKYKKYFSNGDFKRAVWRILSKIPKEYLMRCGRCYGGGLYKLEPKELSSVKIPNMDYLFRTFN